MQSVKLILAIFFLITTISLIVFKGHLSAPILLSYIALVTFFYGHFYKQLKNINLILNNYIRHRFLVIAFILIFFLIATILINVSLDKLININVLVLTMSIVLILFPTINVVLFHFPITQFSSNDRNMSKLTADSNLLKPDIYLIILDAYTRDDVLKKNYQFDNSDFLNFLEDKEFYIAKCAQSNYGWTALSMSSMLNINYIDPSNSDDTIYDLGNSTVKNIFQSYGYKTISMENDFGFLRSFDGDVKIDFEEINYQDFNNQFLYSLNDFENLLLHSSIGLVWLDYEISTEYLSKVEFKNFQRFHRLNYFFDELMKVPDIIGPKFVYIHLVLPHEPFIFDEKGKLIIEGDDLIPGYANQLSYLNTELQPIITNIISSSAEPPIIIMAGDHGPPHYLSEYVSKNDRMKILNSFYFPDQYYGNLYSSITPVNSFRIVLQQYFGFDLNTLKDISYYGEIDNISRNGVPPQPLEIIENNCQ